ncbi:MAG: hypothetical protein A2W31_13400 [Planctomycetes bacterium RBG_16_64_10]|nr:MAG: hypothetical protein A2W31_13400 [Planctomycetes bacterium RBG_16_64_10]
MQRSLPTQDVAVETLVYWALRHSPYVRAISETPLIRETAIVEAQADFDWVGFMESKFDDISLPVGNLLETGGPSRFRDHIWDYAAGVRRRNACGGRLEIAQRIGYRDNNSNFFVPTQQGSSRLSLSYTQPLLSGRGPAVNTSLIVLADIDTSITWNELAEQLQDHLVEVIRTYWELYLGRSTLLQRERHLGRVQEILEELECRREIDALQSQIVLARAAVATRQAELVRAQTRARNAETHLRTLVNAPQLTGAGAGELIPVDQPGQEPFTLPLRDALQTTLQHRPEIDAAVSRMQAASVRLNVSRNQLLPILNLVLETYVNGLEGQSDIGQAIGNQFAEGEPSYSAGLQFEVPLGNRAALARYKRRQLEVRQLFEEFQATVETLMGEVEVAVREVSTTHREMHGHYRSMVANQIETDYLHQRWQLLPGDDRAASFLLQELLDSQDRLAIEEAAFAEAQLAYMVSLPRLSRAMGTLLEEERVSAHRTCECGVPSLILDKPVPPQLVAPQPDPQPRATDARAPQHQLAR